MKNIQNVSQNQDNTKDSREIPNADNSRKAWENPSIVEISRLSILGGPNSGKDEGPTTDGSQ